MPVRPSCPFVPGGLRLPTQIAAKPKGGGGGDKKSGDKKGPKKSAIAELMKKKEAAAAPAGDAQAGASGLATPEQYNNPDLRMFQFLLANSYWKLTKKWVDDHMRMCLHVGGATHTSAHESTG